MDVEQWQFDQPAYATATVAPGASTVAEVTVTIRNVNGKPMGGGYHILFLSDSPIGVGLTAVTASGAVACKGAFGADIQIISAKKALLVQPLNSGALLGIYVLSITDAAKTPFKICVQIGGMTFVIATLATASYGP